MREVTVRHRIAELRDLSGIFDRDNGWGSGSTGILANFLLELTWRSTNIYKIAAKPPGLKGLGHNRLPMVTFDGETIGVVPFGGEITGPLFIENFSSTLTSPPFKGNPKSWAFSPRYEERVWLVSDDIASMILQLPPCYEERV
ncbi:hypothetical protein M5K25_013029 [Dendrobium thyrsiflorum]|uniref:Uncharacterized protein n=1 Tax=Dendrobium thyrsiflorum TaxID=117978 RepID=A0ABD0UYR1_DENTH